MYKRLGVIHVLLFFQLLYRMSEEKDEEEQPKRESNLDPSLWPSPNWQSPNQMVPPFLSEQESYTGFGN